MQPIFAEERRLRETKGVDVEHLHSLLMGEIPYGQRGVGKSFAKCVDVCELAMLKEKYIIFLVDYLHEVSYLMPMIEKICKHYKLNLKIIRNNHFIINQSNLIFISNRNMEKLNGFHNPAIVEIEAKTDWSCRY